MEAQFPHDDGMDMGMDHSHDHADSGASAASSSDQAGHDGHDMGMMAVFQNMMQTSLYSEAWTPSNTGTYAATCIFLVALATIMRALLAGKAILEQRWLDREMRRRYVVVEGKEGLGQRLSSDTGSGGSIAKQMMILSENGREENVAVVERKTGPAPRPWRFSVDPLRAVLDTVIAGVGYLLMLAVMSMNVGYFLSVLGGVFLGSLVVGRFTTSSEH